MTIYLWYLRSKVKFEKFSKKGKYYNAFQLFYWIIAYSRNIKYSTYIRMSYFITVGENKMLSIYSSGPPGETNRAPSFILTSRIVSLCDIPFNHHMKRFSKMYQRQHEPVGTSSRFVHILYFNTAGLLTFNGKFIPAVTRRSHQFITHHICD